MRLKNNMKNKHMLTAVAGIIFFAAGLLPSFGIEAEITFNDGNSTNYIGNTNAAIRLKVGSDEPGNYLYVTNGGLISVTKDVYVGESSTNNLLAVQGTGRVIIGAVDTNNMTTGGIAIGDTNGVGRLKIDNDSFVETDYLYVGLGSNETGTVTITGGGQLDVYEQLVIGTDANSNNVVNISDGGALFIEDVTTLVIQNNSDATNNYNELNVNADGQLLIGDDVVVDDLLDTDNLNFASGAILGVGGEVELSDGAFIEDGLNIVLDNNLSTNTASWSGSALYAGDETSDNSLTLTNGASATASGIVYVGSQSGSTGNSLNIYGSNSVLTANNKLFIGNNGSDNSLTVSDEGEVSVALDLKLGVGAASDNNSAMVGTNATLTVGKDVIVGVKGSDNEFNVYYGDVDVTGDFILGEQSAGNSFTQEGGTTTVTGEFIIGETENASGDTGTVNSSTIKTSGNIALIETNAVLTLESGLTVGLEGSGSILAIRDGGVVNVDGDVVIGEESGDNYIYLQRDSNTEFNVTGDLIVGDDDDGSNRFAIYGGTANIAGDLYLGNSTDQHEIKNFIYLETSNAVLNVANSLYVGASNSINTLDIYDGATVNAQDVFVGAYEGTTNNVVTISGTDALLAVTNTLTIGSTTGSNNTVLVEDGGIVFAGQTNIVIAGTNNTLQIADGGTLKTGDWDFDLQTGNATNILLESGSTLHMLGSLSGTNEVSGSRTFVFDGTNSTWNIGTNAIYVGNEDSNNALTITNGAEVATTTNFYIGFASDNNMVTVGGTGSYLYVAADLYIGNETNDAAYYNTLQVLSGGSVTIDGNLTNSQAGTLKISSDSQVVVNGSYSQTINTDYSDNTVLEIGVSADQTEANLVVEGTADFASGVTLSFINEDIDSDDTNVVQNVVVAGELTIDGETAYTSLLLESLNIETNLLMDFDVSVSNGTTIVLDNFIVYSLGDAANLEGQLLEIGEIVDDLADEDDETAEEMLSILDQYTSDEAKQIMENHYGKKMSSIPAHNAINMGLQSVAEQLTKRADSTRSRMAEMNPAGAAGPHQDDQPLQGWVTSFKTWVDRSAASGFDGYDGSIGGFLIGADFAIEDGILIGIAGGSSSASLDKDSGASIDSSTTIGSLYASMGTKDWFADAGFIFGSSSVDVDMGSVFDTEADFDAKNVAFYMGGGKEIIGDYLIITPQASLLGNYYSQDGYEETSTSALARKVDSFDAFYVQSSVGCNLSFYSTVGETVVKPEFRAFWLHEFNAREEDLSYSLVGQTGSYDLQMQAPESDIIKLGGGVSAQLGEYLEIRADLDTRFGSGYSDYTLLGSIRYQF
jgi:T5SS/PEP-CTERM-associated repeat protein